MVGGFSKAFSPSKSTTSPRASLTGSVENNENDSGRDQVIPRFRSPKKMVAKHFMSSTLSAASKATPPRKKILVERNENSVTSDAENLVETDLQVKNSLHNLCSGRSDNLGPEPCDEWETGSSDDLSVKTYNPLTNYLSPRPKYLRFDPNRRSEIFNRLEKEGIDLSCLLSPKGDVDEDEEEYSSFSSPVRGIEENDEQDGNISDEEEEVEEERGWCLKGVLKLLLLFTACLSFVLYICPVDYQAPLVTQQALWNLTDHCLLLQKQDFEAIRAKIYDVGFVEVGNGFQVDKEVEIGENYIRDKVSSESKDEEAQIKQDSEEIIECDEEKVGNDGENGGDNVDSAAETEGELDFKEEGIEDLISAETEKSEGLNEDDVNNDEDVDSCVIKDVEGEPETTALGLVQLMDASAAETEDAKDSNQLVFQHLVDFISEDDDLQSSDGSGSGSESSEEYITPLEKSTDSGNEIIGHGHGVEKEKPEWNNVCAITGVCIAFISLASLVFIHFSKKPSKTYTAKSKAVMTKQQKVAEEEKKVNPMPPPAVARKIEFLTIPSLLPQLGEVSHDHHNHIHAPMVELIGEIDVGQMISSRRNFGTKLQMTESQARNVVSPGLLRQPYFASFQTSPASECGTNSSSHGSLNTERKTRRKEGGQSRQETMIESTPVRRSNRLRKSVQSS